MREKLKVAGAFLIGLSVASSVTYAQLGGRGRNIAFVDGTAISPSSVTTTGDITANGDLTVGADNTDSKVCFDGPACVNKIDVTQSNDFMTAWSNNTGVWTATPSFFYVYKQLMAQQPVVSLMASGSQSFSCANLGCRLNLGSTARYLTDDGTNLEFVAPVQATSFEATNTTANAALFSGGSATNAMYFQSNTTDAFTGSATGYDSAFVFKINENVSDTDIVFSVLAQNNTIPLYLQENGNLNARGNINTGQSGEFSSTAAVPIVIAGRQADGASSVGVVLRTNSNLTTSGAKIVSVRNNVSTEVASIDKDGLLRVNAANAAKPTCNATNRGRIYYSDGAAGVADTFEVCGKDAADVYAWKAIVTF